MQLINGLYIVPILETSTLVFLDWREQRRAQLTDRTEATSA